MKITFSNLFDKAYNTLISGKYKTIIPQKGYAYIESGIFKSPDMSVARGFKVGTSLFNNGNPRNIYVQRIEQGKNPNKSPMLLLAEANTSSPDKAYLFSHHDYYGDGIHQLNPLTHFFGGTGYCGQDLSQDSYYVKDSLMYTPFVEDALWRRGTLKYIRDAITSFVEKVGK